MKNRAVKEKNIGTILMLFAFSCLIGVFTLLSLQIHHAGQEMYASSGNAFSFFCSLCSQTSVLDILSAVSITIIFSLLLILYYLGKCSFFNKFHKYRYYIAGCVIILIVALNVNNTSLYKWSDYIKLTGGEKSGPFWGVARGIRMDEWGVWSPMTFSQAASGYPSVNNAISGGGIDPSWISVGGIPAFSLAAVFKPFYWGFFMFGISRGYSFLFALRIVLLFLTSYELAFIYTRKNKALSLAAAMMMTLAPYVQWWFSQSIAEVLIFGQAIILFAFHYFQANNRYIKTLLAILLAYSIGCYVLVGYPSWLIGGAYLIVPVCILIIIRGKKLKWDFFRLTIPIIACLAMLGVILYQTKDTLSAVMGSVYPGARLITGGVFSDKISEDLYAMFLPFAEPLLGNASESAVWITFAPAGIILSIYNMVKARKVDAVCCILLSVEFVFLLFCFIGFPEWLVRITLLRHVNRPELVVGLCDLILLFYGLSRRKEEWNPWTIVILSITSLFLHVCYLVSNEVTDELLLGVTICIYLFVYLALFSCSLERPRTGRFLACVLCVVAILEGGFVNPLQQGTECITELKLSKAIRETGSEDDLWFVEGGYPMTNFPLFSGKRVFDSTQPYANTEKWASLDQIKTYTETYNRFANISGTLTAGETEFSLIAPDHLLLKMSIHELSEQKIRYVLSPNVYQPEGSGLIQVAEADGYKIYEVRKTTTGEKD